MSKKRRVAGEQRHRATRGLRQRRHPHVTSTHRNTETDVRYKTQQRPNAPRRAIRLRRGRCAASRARGKMRRCGAETARLLLRSPSTTTPPTQGHRPGPHHRFHGARESSSSQPSDLRERKGGAERRIGRCSCDPPRGVILFVVEGEQEGKPASRVLCHCPPKGLPLFACASFAS